MCSVCVFCSLRLCLILRCIACLLAPALSLHHSFSRSPCLFVCLLCGVPLTYIWHTIIIDWLNNNSNSYQLTAYLFRCVCEVTAARSTLRSVTIGGRLPEWQASKYISSVSFVRIELNFFTTYRRHRRKKWWTRILKFELCDFWDFFEIFKKASRGPSAADLDHYGRGQTRSE